MKTFKKFRRNIFLPYIIFLSRKDDKIKDTDDTMTRIRVMEVILFEFEKSRGRVLCKSLGGGRGAAVTMKTLTLY